MIGKIKKNHNFSCSINIFTPEGTQLVVKLRKSNREGDKETNHLAIKMGFEGWHECKSLKDSVANCPNMMRKISPAMIDSPGINACKKVETNEK